MMVDLVHFMEVAVVDSVIKVLLATAARVVLK